MNSAQLSSITQEQQQLERLAYIALLLALFGKGIQADRCNTESAIILAKTYLQHNYSAATALSEGYKFLKLATPIKPGAIHE